MIIRYDNNNAFHLDNKKRIKMYIGILLFLLCSDIILLFVCIIYPIEKGQMIILGFLLLVMFFLCIKLWKIKFFEIESSGMVCSIKLYPPLKKGWIIPIIEFPINVLDDFSFVNNQLYIQLKRHDGLLTKVRLYVVGISRNQKQELRANFNKILNKTETK